MILVEIHRICYNGIHTVTHTASDYVQDVPFYGMHDLICSRDYMGVKWKKRTGIVS